VTVAAPAVGVTFQVDMGDGTAMILQTHYDQELPYKERSELHDRMYFDAERMRARVRIKALDQEAAGIALQRSHGKPQIERAEENYQREVARITDEANASAEADAKKHEAGERRGPYKPSTQEKQRQIGFQTQLERLRAERESTLKNFEATDKTLEAGLLRLKAERDVLQAVVDAAFSRADH
jgi:hypothetical protein